MESTPQYLLDRDPAAYAPFWGERKLRRLVLLTGLPLPFFFFPIGFVWFLILTWFAGGLRCPRCKHRFARGRLSLLFGTKCAYCELFVYARRDLTEAPMFPVSTVPAIRRFRQDEWRSYRALRLAALADSPDAFGSTLAIERNCTDEEWSRRLAADPGVNFPIVARIGAEAVGLAWGRIEPASPDTAHLYQLWVAHAHRQRAIGRMLLDTVIDWARASNLRKVVLSATCGDTPALRLYSRAGFVAIGDPASVRPGSTLLAQTMELALERRDT